MPQTIHVEAQRTIDQPPDAVYALVRDYSSRPRYLPPNYENFTVESGGQGDGTVFSYLLKAARRERVYHMRAAEPSARTLREADTGSSLVTTWTVTPAAEPERSVVRIVTEWTGSGGIGGFFERTFAPGGLRRIYDELLERLAAAAGR